jgi:conjugal transfer/entry exclusion protein
MKNSKFEKWYKKEYESSSDQKLNDSHRDELKKTWNAAMSNIYKEMKRRNKDFEGNWQHEDIDYMLEYIQETIEK